MQGKQITLQSVAGKFIVYTCAAPYIANEFYVERIDVSEPVNVEKLGVIE